MPQCLRERSSDWLSDAIQRTVYCIETIQEMRDTSSRDSLWPNVQARGEAAILELAFLREGAELVMKLQEAIINGHRERSREVDEPVPVHHDGCEPPTGVLLTRGFRVQGAQSGRTNSSVPNNARPPIREVPTPRDLWQVEGCQENSHYPLSNDDTN